MKDYSEIEKKLAEIEKTVLDCVVKLHSQVAEIRATVDAMKRADEAESGKANSKHAQGENRVSEPDTIFNDVKEEATPKTDKVFGIDLGMTNSSIAVVNENGVAEVIGNMEGDKTTPSCVYFESENSIVVGAVAKANINYEPDKVVAFIKRVMGKDGFNYDYNGVNQTPEMISALILRKIVSDAQILIHEEIRDVVITHPAYFGIREKEATKISGEIAGLNVVGMIPEPVAVALSYGITPEKYEGKTLLVFDFGGASLDITVLRVTDGVIEIVCTDGDDCLGGHDWDERLVNYLLEQAVKQTDFAVEDIYNDIDLIAELIMKAESAKKSLSARDSAVVRFLYNNCRVAVTISREEFELITKDLLEKAISYVRNVVDMARDRGYDEIDTVLIAGGASYMPQIREAIIREFGKEPLYFDPEFATSKGAAIYAAKEQLWNKPDEIPWTTMGDIPYDEPLGGYIVPANQVSYYGYGFKAGMSGKEVICQLITVGQELPISITRSFATMSDNQETVLIPIWRSNSYEDIVEDLSTAECIGEAEFVIPPNTPAGTNFNITVNLNTCGVLEAVFENPQTGETQTVVFEAY